MFNSYSVPIQFLFHPYSIADDRRDRGRRVRERGSAPTSCFTSSHLLLYKQSLSTVKWLSIVLFILIEQTLMQIVSVEVLTRCYNTLSSVYYSLSKEVSSHMGCKVTSQQKSLPNKSHFSAKSRTSQVALSPSQVVLVGYDICNL